MPRATPWVTTFALSGHHAKMKGQSRWQSRSLTQRLNETLEDVEVADRRALLVGNLSGGQRKRVSIAMELLANPHIFFLDEPTSGLNPGLDRKIMLLLLRFADRGRTVVLVTHATTNINECDSICFLAQGGRLAYFGPPDKERAFFAKSDFAEIYTVLEATSEHPQAPQDAEALYRSSPDYQRYVAQPLDALTQHH